MRTEFMQCESLEVGYDAAPWAYLVVEVEGGYRAFESMDDYETWWTNE